MFLLQTNDANTNYACYHSHEYVGFLTNILDKTKSTFVTFNIFGYRSHRNAIEKGLFDLLDKKTSTSTRQSETPLSQNYLRQSAMIVSLSHTLRPPYKSLKQSSVNGCIVPDIAVCLL